MQNPSKFIVLCIVFVAFLAACGDSNQSNNTTSDMIYVDSGTDMGTAQPDMQKAPDMQSTSDMNEIKTLSNQYESALENLGSISEKCDRMIAQQNKGNQYTRVFVPSLAFAPDDLATHANWRHKMHRFVHEQVAPCMGDVQDHVVVFPTSTALATLLIGDKARTARAQLAPVTALAALLTPMAQSVAYYERIYPDLSLGQMLVLAMTDSVARALVDTYGQLAKTYKIWTIASYYGAPFEWQATTEQTNQLSDPDYEPGQGVYVATSADVALRHVVFDPDGKMVSQTLKQRHGLERDVLGIKDNPIHALSTITVPGLGRVAWTSGVEATEPDIMSVLDDMGTTTYITGSIERQWVADDSRWTPTQAMFQSWYPIQMGYYAQRGISPQLHGQVAALDLGGQAHMMQKAHTVKQPDQFIGQVDTLFGPLWIDPWPLPDPQWTTLTTQDLRQKLGASLPSVFQHQTSMYVVDVAQEQTKTQQQHPTMLQTKAGIFVLHDEGVVGNRHFVLKKLIQGQLITQQTIALADHDLIRPQMAIGPQGQLHVVGEAKKHNEKGTLVYTTIDPETATITPVLTLPFTKGHAYRPMLMIEKQTLHLSWIESGDQGQQAYYTQSTFMNRSRLGVPQTMFANTVPRALGQGPRQWDIKLAQSGHTLAASWLKQENNSWHVELSISRDSGLTWSTPEVMTTWENTNHVNQVYDLTLKASTKGFVLAWTTHKDASAHTTIATRRIDVTTTQLNALPISKLNLAPNVWATQPVWGDDSTLYYTRHAQQEVTIARTKQGDDGVWYTQPEPLPGQVSPKFDLLPLTVQDSTTRTYLLYAQSNTDETTITLKLAR